MLIGFGCLIGFCFAVVTLAISAVSLPPLLDRNVGAAMAIATSIEAVWENPITMTFLGFIVAAALLIGSLPFFIGLAIVMPILGHSTWQLYRRVIISDPTRERSSE
jgi:uncharacterized membrane protein